jgi:DNA-binding CsgD family transcriptional regulator
VAALDVGDLQFLATSAYMLGRDEEYVGVLERAHQACLDRGDVTCAVRCASWIGLNLALRREMARATGWLGRAQRLLGPERTESAEYGYLLLLSLFEFEPADWEAAAAVAAEAVRVGQRFEDADLLALALHEHGHILIRHGRIKDGLRLQDEAMVALTTGKLSPIASGLVYCAVIGAYQEVYEVRRAQEWTDALTRWCEQQPGLVAFTGLCLVHRAEIMQLHGAWREALVEARRPGLFRAQGLNRTAAAQALYRQGELHRLQGAFTRAEEAYREANRAGFEPQPGLALLRLAQGKGGAAAAAIRRAVGEGNAVPGRVSLLAAYVEIALAIGDVEDARARCDELADVAGGYGSPLVHALVAHARGAVELAEGDPGVALGSLRTSLDGWRALEAPYEAARTRELLGLACRALGDEDTAILELETTRAELEELGAAPDLARVEALVRAPTRAVAGGLTARELEVLSLVASGKTNRTIAADLVISEKTVARHVSNIFVKLGISSRAAATAYAYEHELV